MQEHIRRAHPEYYIPKLPATVESFNLMVNTPLHERPPKEQPEQQQQPSHVHAAPPGGFPETNGVWYAPGVDQAAGYATDMHSYYTEDYNSFVEASGRNSDEFRRGSLLPAASAAAALAQLHTFRPDTGWESEQVKLPRTMPSLSGRFLSDPMAQDLFPDIDKSNHKPRAHFAPIPVDPQMFVEADHGQSSPPSGRPPELLPSSLARSPPLSRPSTLPPLQRAGKVNRPRKPSVGQNARKPKHERQRSKDHARKLSYDRKAFSAEPQAAAIMQGRRWEDLIDAAASATEEDSRDLTPVNRQFFFLSLA